MKHLLKMSLILMVFNIYFVHSQEEISGSTLWIKGQLEKDSVKTKETAKLKNVHNESFNFNPIVDFSKSKISKKTKYLVKNQSSLFLVFKCSGNEETNLITFQKGISKTYFTSKKITSDSEIILNKGDSHKGIILSYLSTNNSIFTKKGGNLVLDDALFNDVERKNQLMEMLYFPEVLKESDKNNIESYLSIKYGISLIGEKDYFNSKGTKIWDFKSNAANNYRVTGIGRDDFFNLNQKQSGNYEKDGLYIGLRKIEKTNLENNSIINDRSYMVWGDNNKTVLFDKQENGDQFKKMKRIWKTQTNSENPLTVFKSQFLVNKKEMIFEKNKDHSKEEEIWLAIDSSGTNEFNYASAMYIKASLENEEQLIFDNVKLKSNASYLFTFIKGPDFFMNYNVTAPNCNPSKDGAITINLLGGSAPYSIHLKSEKFEKNLTSNQNLISIENLTAGNYQLEISDKKQILKSSFEINAFENNTAYIDSQYYLNDNKEIEISPFITSKSENKISYKWFSENNLISTESKISANAVGNYKLILSNESGCTKEYPFLVRKKQNGINGGWTLFPNPVKSGERFSIQFQLKELTNVIITIIDVNGKMLINKNLGNIKEYQYETSLLASGTYLISISQNGKIETAKLIIK
jgi:hypothetical protein